MNCAESRQLLHAQVDGELDAAYNLELEGHLKTCPDCAAASQSLQALQAALRQPALRYDAPEALRKQIRGMVRGSRSETGLGLLQSLRFWRSLAFGATALALLVLLTRPGLPQRDQMLEEAVANHVRSLMVAHLTDVSSSDQHTVKPWFNGKLDFAPEVKDFGPQGFPLVGGRLDYLNGRPVAALVYRRDKHLINVFVWPAAGLSSRKTAIEHRRGYSVINCEAQGLHYCLVSDLNRTELAILASLLER